MGRQTGHLQGRGESAESTIAYVLTARRTHRRWLEHSTIAFSSERFGMGVEREQSDLS